MMTSPARRCPSLATTASTRPSRPFSTAVIRAPPLASVSAATLPAGPAPTTTASKGGTVLGPGVDEQVAMAGGPVEVQQGRLRFRLDDRDRAVVPGEGADGRAGCPERVNGEF